MKPSFSVLLAEPNMVLREKIASILASDERVWCVVQVREAEGLQRGSSRLQPDLILANWSILKNPDIVEFIRRFSSGSRVVALTDGDAGPYLQTARRLGLDGCLEKGRVGEALRDELSTMRNSGSEP